MFLPVSAQSWDQTIQIIHLPNLVVKTRTMSDFVLSLCSLSQYSHRSDFVSCHLSWF